jgi:hypothetical protein
MDSLQQALERSTLRSDVSYETAEGYHRIYVGTGQFGIRALRDLAGFSGFHATTPILEALTLADLNGRRVVFGRVYEILSLTQEGREVLAEAFSPAITTQGE